MRYLVVVAVLLSGCSAVDRMHRGDFYCVGACLIEDKVYANGNEEEDKSGLDQDGAGHSGGVSRADSVHPLNDGSYGADRNRRGGKDG